MITFAKLKHLKDKEFKKLHKEVAEYHKKVDYFFDWSRQWEYPWILKSVLFNDKDIVLDIGGGTSHFPSLVARRVKKVIVGDLYLERMFKSESTNVSFLKINALEVKSRKKYDIVMCISVLEHIDNYFKAIKNLTKLVKKNGYLVMTLDLFLDDFRNCKKSDIPEILKLLKGFDLGEVDLSEDELYRKTTLQDMKLDLPNLYSRNYKDRTSLGIIIKKI